MNEVKKTILIVEDDSFVMDIYETKVLKEGFGVVKAVNGVEAMEKLEKDPAPDLILLDIVMPYMSGLEVLKKLKKDAKLSKIPVVLLTNLSQKEEIQEGFDLGAQDYLIKSHFTPTEVMEKINKYLNK